jgi:uncharacterized protein YbjT (DUF2867 family)
LGQEVVKQALADGHTVTAYARTPASLGIEQDALAVIQGELNDAEKIRQAVAGAEAVISALGPTNNTPERPITEGMQNIIAAMDQEKVSRLIAATGAGVGDPNDKPGLLHRAIGLTLRISAKNVLEDSVGMVDAIRSSDLAWTLVRAPRLNDKPATGKVKVGYMGQGPGTQLTRGDFASFMLDQLESDEWMRKAPRLSN